MNTFHIVGAASFLALTLVAAPAQAQTVPVPGSDNSFKAEVTRQIGKEKDVALKLTGVALREKAWFNVYAMGSYIAKASKVKTAEDLAKADEPKMLELLMEREVDGEDMASAFRDAIRANYPKGFDAELKKIDAYFKPKTVKPGDRIKFVHIPGSGVRCEVSGQKALFFEGVKFSKVIWDMYLGKENVSEDIKEGLVSRLK